MNLKVRWLLVVLLVFSLIVSPQKSGSALAYSPLFERAEKLFNGEATAETDSIALTYYNKIIHNVSLSSETCILLYNSYERSGILKQELQSDSREALTDFYHALFIYHTYKLSDSLVYRLFLSIGNTHYASGIFDSSLYYFNRAEKIIEEFPHAGYAEDLYNSVGALYSEQGNYRQSTFYFQRALDIVRATRPELKEAQFAMSANIAASLRLLGNLDSAIVLYRNLLNSGKKSDPVLTNLAKIYLEKNNPDSALFFLKKMTRQNPVFEPLYLNTLGLVYLQKNKLKNAEELFNKSYAYYKQKSKKFKNAYFGTTCKYLGDLKMQEKKFQEALTFYQQAIIQLKIDYNDSNFLHNPENFIGDFASFELFKTLAAKANCFTEFFQFSPKKSLFDAAKHTYESAFKLAEYIKRSADNDEARLFLSDDVVTAYREAVNFVLEKYKISKEAYLINAALEWVGRSRATSLTIALNENRIKKFSDIPDSLLQKEKRIQVNISRLRAALINSYDSAYQSKIDSKINEAEVNLQQLLASYKNYPKYYQEKFKEDSFSIRNIQSYLNSKTAVVCYYERNKSLAAFVIRRDDIHLTELSNPSLMKNCIERFVSTLQSADDSGSRDDSLSFCLYNQLVNPLQLDLESIQSLIVIPDHFLINLPFESLQKEDGNYLIEDLDFTYQYALPFVSTSTNSKGVALAFAPFADYKSKQNQLPALPYSKAEVETFAPDQKIINESASKKAFLFKFPNANTIHLATHAFVNYQNPQASYISFYPEVIDSSSKLYADEISTMDLSKTNLVFLSACETAGGKVSQSEGSLSLSRAFTLAGCKNIVTSLWKAADEPTAYLSNKLYAYLDKGHTYAHSLRLAKMDLLRDPSMSQYHHPKYWSHLILVGTIPIQNHSLLLRIISICLAIAAGVLLLIFQRKRRPIHWI